eukprot:3387346-Amphidinium_carterae.1
MDSNYNYTIKFPTRFSSLRVFIKLTALSTTGQKLTATSEDPTNTPLSTQEAETYRTTMGQLLW